ncbi:MAG: hypothetical protein RMJ19_00875 [Gemmatales bacterium]|nr:hypothetical protein [Gemmatales bacterium]MDW8174198.1 hypothetical protein [Gemmatales bacterium]
MLGYLDLWHWPALRFLRWELRIFNRKAAKHPKGLWDLGDHSSLLLRFLSLRIKFEKPAEEIYYTTSEDNQYSTVGGVEAYIHQESSGGCAWRHANHVNRIGRIGVRFAGGVVQNQEGTLYAPRLEPLVVAKFGDEYLLLALHPFWQAFPRAIRISREQIVLEGLSSCSSGTAQFHELQGGECFRLQGIVLWSKNIIPDRSALEWYLAPFHAVPTWQYLADCGSLREVGIFGSPESEEWRNFLSGRDLVEELQSKVMQQDEFGWRNFGEIPADHERIYYRGHAPFVSHYNNQYDLLAGLIYMLLYRQDVRLLEYIHALARHVADIDIYHTREDRAAYNHGMFWHTAHYETAGLATHRTFSRIQTSGAGETGGGPSCEHLYSSGLYWYYLLSGEPWARDAVMELADFVIARDDGTKTIYRYFDRGPTGLASRTREEDYHGPGRGPGNAIDTLLNAWLLSGACKYVQKIRELIHRCFHPDNDVAALNLLDAENRWSYTVFLEAVIRFIEVSLSSDSYDDTVVYAASALLRYAKWMAVHERPYLEHAESLEYPTETWPCQDLRKSVILRWAARWAETPWIERMLSKAEAISRSAWESFRKFETCFTTRPLTLILTVGLREACLRKYHQCRCSDTLRAAMAESHFPPPLQFSPIEKRVWNKFPQACRWALRMLRDFLRQAR